MFQAQGRIGTREWKLLTITTSEPGYEVRRRYLNQLINNLHDRFPEDDLELLECFDVIFNPRRLPDDARELGKHGIQQLNKLCHHFETVLDSDECKNQFLQFKHLLRSYRAMNFEQFTSTLIHEY